MTEDPSAIVEVPAGLAVAAGAAPAVRWRRWVSARPGGEARRRVGTLGRRYVAGIRVITFAPIGLVAVLAADDPVMRGRVELWLLAFAGWSVAYVACVLCGRTTLVTVVDGLLLCGLGLATAMVTPTGWLESGRTWIRPFVTFAAVGYQYSTPWRVGLPMGLAACTAAAIAAVAGQGALGADSVVTVVWSNLIAVLGRVLFTLLNRAAARVDETLADAETARRKQEVAENVRADERSIGDALHDTAAATLLMVAVGQAGGLGTVLRERAQHDLDTLRDLRTGVHTGPVDLCRELRAHARRCAVTVTIHGPEELDVPAQVARALADAAGEALTNVARHAGTASARLHFEKVDGRVLVEIADEGRGFELDNVPTTGRGLGRCIVDRVEAVGGQASITSLVGKGTTVRLAWPA